MTPALNLAMEEQSRIIERLRAIVGEQGERLFGLYAEEDRLATRVIVLEALASEQADKIVRYEAELARVYLIADQYLRGRGCGHCRRIIEGRPAEDRLPASAPEERK